MLLIYESNFLKLHHKSIIEFGKHKQERPKILLKLYNLAQY